MRKAWRLKRETERVSPDETSLISVNRSSGTTRDVFARHSATVERDVFGKDVAGKIGFGQAIPIEHAVHSIGFDEPLPVTS